MTEQTVEIRVISRGTYLQALGLLTLADQHYQTLQNLEATLAEVLNEPADAHPPHYYGHVSDVIYSGESGDPTRTLGVLLKHLGITVADEEGEVLLFGDGTTVARIGDGGGR